MPSPGNLPNPGIEPGSPALQTNFYKLSYQGSPNHAILVIKYFYYHTYYILNIIIYTGKYIYQEKYQ